jgi:gamma-glutamyltranspeptidase/glutathione hydrolase
MADDQFVPVPTQELYAPAYLDSRAAEINLARAPGNVGAGQPAGVELYERWGRDDGEDNGTTHISIIDAWGNAVSMTATVESAFGSQRMASGFFLNNELTDFAFEPTLNGRPLANAAASYKRPRSSMSPVIITDRDGELQMVIGSPGGSSIIGYVARTTIGILDWNMPVQDAINLSNITARFSPANLEAARLPAGVGEELTRRGWEFRDVTGLEESGIHAIRVRPNGFEGGGDPRREGIVGRIPSTAQAAATTPPAR